MATDILTKPLNQEEDGDILFAATGKPVKRTPEDYAQRRRVAVGALRPGTDKAEIIADASLNTGESSDLNVTYVG